MLSIDEDKHWKKSCYNSSSHSFDLIKQRRMKNQLRLVLLIVQFGNRWKVKDLEKNFIE